MRAIDFLVVLGVVLLVGVLGWFVSVIVSYIAFRMPEGLLLSHVQILRAIDLYKEIKILSPEQATRKIGSQSLVEYLQNIPPEVIGYTWESLEQFEPK